MLLFPFSWGAQKTRCEVRAWRWLHVWAHASGAADRRRRSGAPPPWPLARPSDRVL